MRQTLTTAASAESLADEEPASQRGTKPREKY